MAVPVRRLYTIETSTDLTPGVWIDLAGLIDIVGTGGVQSIVDPNPSVVLRHYRVKVRLP